MSQVSPPGREPSGLQADSTPPDAPTRQRAIPGSAPSRIGPYRVLEEVGRGGMGVVYKAERHDLRQVVALKLIKLGMDTEEVMARFESERQALAVLNHPNVARVFDAGATETGRPYFVMEFVPGVPLSEYCDRNRLTTNERLELFLQACDAIQHAHQKGIIHRDLKPSNMLVMLQDGKPLVKVIDFGVAKATSTRLSDHSFYTERGQLIGTPEYMSPEQAEMGALDIDTRSDVYSLGVVLYELLIGVQPFESTTLRQASYDEIRRIIREVEPPRPSTKLHALGRSGTTVAHARRADARSLNRQLKGDLDWIVMKAMEKDRTRRYASAGELAADIHRHLRDEPVTAGPPSRVYKLHKFVRRNRGSVIAATLLLATLLAGIAGTTVGLIRAKRSEARANAEARRAETEARRADAEKQIALQVKDFLVQLFWMGEPSAARGKEVTVREMLDVGAEQIRAQLRDQPAVQIELLQTIGMVYSGMGLYQQAEPLLREAEDLAIRTHGPDSSEALSVRSDLAGVIGGLGRLEEAIRLYRDGVDRASHALGEEHPLTLQLMNNLAWGLLQAGRFRESAELNRHVYEVRLRVLGEKDPATLTSLHNLVNMLLNQHHLDEAEPLLRRLCDVRVQMHGRDHPQTLTTLGNLVMLLSFQGKHEEAETLLRQVLADRRRVLGEKHPETLGSLDHLGSVLRAAGKLEEAEQTCREAFEMRRAVLGPTHGETFSSMNSLAAILRDRGKYDEAIELARQGLQASRDRYGEDFWSTHALKITLGATLQEQGKPAEAEPLLLEGYRYMQRIYPSDHPEIAKMRTRLVRVYEALGQPEKAEPYKPTSAATTASTAAATTAPTTAASSAVAP